MLLKRHARRYLVRGNRAVYTFVPLSGEYWVSVATNAFVIVKAVLSVYDIGFPLESEATGARVIGPCQKLVDSSSEAVRGRPDVRRGRFERLENSIKVPRNVDGHTRLL